MSLCHITIHSSLVRLKPVRARFLSLYVSTYIKCYNTTLSLNLHWSKYAESHSNLSSE